MEVTKHMNHLLKSPFCVHPKTGMVCVPIDPQNAGRFDPFKVPTVDQLHREMNAVPQVLLVHIVRAAFWRFVTCVCLCAFV